MRTSSSALFLTLLACGGEPEVECGTQSCPVGTHFDEYQASREGFEVTVDVDITTYDGGVAFRNFGEFECQYTCVVTQECPDWTFPVISADCFTCATIEDGEVVGGACGSE